MKANRHNPAQPGPSINDLVNVLVAQHVFGARARTADGKPCGWFDRQPRPTAEADPWYPSDTVPQVTAFVSEDHKVLEAFRKKSESEQARLICALNRIWASRTNAAYAILKYEAGDYGRAALVALGVVADCDAREEMLRLVGL